MSILIVGNVTKDVYLNLDTRTESFETDKTGTKWLNLAFNASEHSYFSREASLGGAAVTLEVLQKLGLASTITGSNLNFDQGETIESSANTYRYIMITDGQPCYLAPTVHHTTIFDTPAEPYDYLYIDRSANLDDAAIAKINAYLDVSPNTKLVLYLERPDDLYLSQLQLLSRANLVFLEQRNAKNTQITIDPAKLILLSDDQISYQNITDHISINRIDILTHLSTYSILAATILGAFILGHSVEDSLRMARANAEHSKLNSTLSLESLQKFADSPESTTDLELIANALVLHPKGILAADESGGSIHKKFEQLNIEDTYDNRRDYRNIFFTTPGLNQYVNGVILFDETARQLADNGQNYVDYLISKRIIPGIKVDQGLEKFQDSEETYTKGLDDLKTRLDEYYQMGLRFAKWRAAFNLTTDEQGNILTPTEHAITENCRILAEYAKACQDSGLVPIVEPEVVYDGNYSIEQSATITAKILDQLFSSLEQEQVNLRACILKVNMILAGKQFETQSTPDEVGTKTAEVLKQHVPDTLAGVVFLSGGQTVEQATDNLAAVKNNGPFPWPITFSFARALQDPALYAWAGDNNNAEKARQAFLDRLIANTKVL